MALQALLTRHRDRPSKLVPLKRMAHAPQRTLLCRDSLLLSFNTRLFVVFSLSQFGQNSRLFAKLFETPDSALDRFIFSHSNTGHGLNHPRSLETYGRSILS